MKVLTEFCTLLFFLEVLGLSGFRPSKLSVCFRGRRGGRNVSPANTILMERDKARGGYCDIVVVMFNSLSSRIHF